MASSCRSLNDDDDDGGSTFNPLPTRAPPRAGSGGAEAPGAALAPDTVRQLLGQVFRETFGAWADENIAVLDGMEPVGGSLGSRLILRDKASRKPQVAHFLILTVPARISPVGGLN